GSRAKRGRESIVRAAPWLTRASRYDGGMAAPPSGPSWLSGLAVVAVGVAVGWLGWLLLTPAPGSDRRRPELTLERLEGGELPLASLAGQPLVVNLWATWCLPCLQIGRAHV